MPSKKQQPPQVQQTANGDDNIQIVGDGNVVNKTVNQTIIQKIFNIFKGDAETLEQRNRRIMLGHVENFWVKGILEKSLHGVALLELGIKEDPDALNYPWAIKREANKETLPAGTSMLEIFQEIGMGRSLLILGAPGSGKTTMLLELTRQLIEQARENVTEPIPVVFNLSSWTEELTLADWLARELNVIYTIPKKIAPTWIKENKMLLLLDGLDEVKQENHAKCVDAINQFRKENDLTSMAVCSRIQDYADLETRLTFDGAIEIQPLTSNQVDEYFKHFSEGLVGIREVLERDTALQEMTKTPLFLNIITLAYCNTTGMDILASQPIMLQRKRLFDTYIARMYSRSERSQSARFDLHDSVQWLTWVAHKMIEQNTSTYIPEFMKPAWLSNRKKGSWLKNVFGIVTGLAVGLIVGLVVGLVFGLARGPMQGLFAGLIFGTMAIASFGWSDFEDTIFGVAYWSWKQSVARIFFWLIGGLVGGLIGGLVNGLVGGLIGVLVGGLTGGLLGGFQYQLLDQTINAGQRITFSLANSFLIFIMVFVMGTLIGALVTKVMIGGIFVGLLFGFWIGLDYGGIAVIQHYFLRLFLKQNNILPLRLGSFLDYCVDMIILRRVGGGYMFIHPLLMEHFAAMYPADEK